MMFGYSDAWWVLLLYPAVLWVPFGPFAMASLGAWCASAPGIRPRLWSVLVPLGPVATSAVVMVFPLSRWERPRQVDGSLGTPQHVYDFLGYLGVYVGAITLLPWLLGFGVTRVVRFLRSRRQT
ncbi:hypothetical protein [Streptomyces sp. CAI-85]|uniref:hypothetical protein n=1 Tax=Streptomyces sp. CAI-85 TaxID=1472662 RepID=UPI001587C331|nr:hypothetical protein [Streptomyces sp. CAI-85]NUV60119.1 hypothetical protein [Streptomyces sp. CAI-85]